MYARFKQEGNEHFKSISEDKSDIPFHEFLKRMTPALDSYNKAKRVAQTNEEKAMISKNLGTAHSKLIQKFVASSASDSRGNILDNLEFTTVYFKDALEFGLLSNQSYKWIEDIARRSWALSGVYQTFKRMFKSQEHNKTLNKAARNLGLVFLLMADQGGKAHSLKAEQRLEHSKTTFNWFVQAWDVSNFQRNKLIENMEMLAQLVYDLHCDLFPNQPPSDENIRIQLGKLHQYGVSLPSDVSKAFIFKKICDSQFKRAVELQEAGGKKHFLAASLLEDNYAFEEAFKIYKEHDRKEMEDLRDSIRFHHCLSRVEILFAVAEDMKRESLFESEEINMLMVWPTVDKYREALLFSNGVCVEKEARIHGQLGRFYDDVLKDSCRAKEHYRQSMFLAQTLKPATIYTQAEWYKHCTKRMQYFQDQAWTKDEETWQKEREPILKELKSVVDKLMEKSKTMKAEEFVAYLHKEHPPKKKQEVKNKTTKEVLRIALLEYHPDKQKKDLKEDKKWFVLSEEVTKILNTYYIAARGMSD